MPRPMTLAIGGAPARASSCQKITCCIRLAPRPPYSRGQEMPAQPPSYSVFCHDLEECKMLLHRPVAAMFPVFRGVLLEPGTQFVAKPCLFE